MDGNARMDKIERRLDATTKLVKTGMRMLVKMQKEQQEFQKETREFKKEAREFKNRDAASDERVDRGAIADRSEVGSFDFGDGVKTARTITRVNEVRAATLP